MEPTEEGKVKTSKFVKLAVIGTPLFFYGCAPADTVIIERRAADNVEVYSTAGPGVHYSYFYGGYVPIFVPIGGYVGNGFYSGGYRAPRTVINNYTRTHTTTIVKAPSTTSSSRSTTTKPGSTISSSRGASSSSSVHSGGFGSTGRGSASVGS